MKTQDAIIRIAAVDDEEHALERFERLIKPYQHLKLCGLFESGDQLLDFLSTQTLDAIFLDIDMPGMNGLQLTERIMEIDADIDIVFVTAYNQYAIEAFELQALDYLLKPLTDVRLDKAIRRLHPKQIQNSKDYKPHIQCFGDFEVFIGEEALVWKNSKAKEILAFLVQKEGITVNWEKITTNVWPEFNTEKAQTNFHATMYLLRKQLRSSKIEHILESGRGKYRIVSDQLTCDLYQLQEMIKENLVKRAEDFILIEKVLNRGYMEESGYSWAQPRAAELEELCSGFMRLKKVNASR